MTLYEKRLARPRRQNGRPYHSLSSPDASTSLDFGGGFLAALTGLSALALDFLDLGSLPRFGFSGASRHIAPIWREREMG